MSAGATTSIRGRVVGIHDGDTLTVLDAGRVQYRIRLGGIDAPEAGQSFGGASKRNLSSLLYGREVDVYTTKTDRHGRLMGKVMLEGRDVAVQQLESGLAWFYVHYETELPKSERLTYAAAERTAKGERRGLWAEVSPIPPWQHRRLRGRASLLAPRNVAAPESGTSSEVKQVMGNRRSRIYHLPDCPDWGKVSTTNREYFPSEAAAVAAGYRRARNCP